MIRTFDLLLASILILLLLPLMAIVAIVVLTCLGRPVLHASRRVGRHGEEYVHRKFRTMRPGAETGRVFFEADRMTRCGRLLRALHLDELPELFGIFTGRLSFVGPRPLPRRLTRGLDTAVRERVPPGWTGTAQLWLLRHGRLDKHHQIELDNAYVARRCLKHNLGIILKTLLQLRRPRPLDLDPAATHDRRIFGRKVQRK